MESYRILRHSIRQVTGNPRAALILSLPVMIVLCAEQMILPRVLVKLELSTIPGTSFFISGLLKFLITLPMAVNWHRHVLLEEPATLRPHIGRMCIYVLRVMQIVLLSMAALMAISMAVSALLNIFANPFAWRVEPTPRATLIAVMGAIPGIGITVWVHSLMMRLSIMLPAAAIGKGIGLRQALVRTRGTTGMMVVLVLITLLLTMVLTIPVIVTHVAEWRVISAVLGFGLNWVVTLLGVSLLTTLYGHYVEGRALN